MSPATELLEALEASTYCLPEAIGGFPQVAGINYTISTALPMTPMPRPIPLPPTMVPRASTA